jgi:hypothetical protein
MTVEKQRVRKFSSLRDHFPQVFHNSLWKMKVNWEKDFWQFYTISQALFLLLDLNRLLSLDIEIKAAAAFEVKPNRS